MIYFDNAATGGFKPRAVTDAADTVNRYLLANPGRSGHRLSITGAKAVSDTREIIAELFNANPDKVIFTKNCTESLNYAIFGSIKDGGHIITTVYEHNSVLRPLYALSKRGIISLDIVAPKDGVPLQQLIKDKINDKTYMIAATSASNVTGEVLPIDEIGKIARDFGLLFLVDGAQAGGHVDIDVKRQNVSFLALAGHKGLYGIMGSGALIINDDCDLDPVIFGGTGSESFNTDQPSSYPDKLESGTLNLPAIVALGEGVRYVKNNLSNFSSHLISSTATLIDGLKKIPNLKCFSSPNPVGIVSFLHKNVPSAELSDLLSRDYDIAVRGGFHCAPLIHKYLNTQEVGAVRASLSVQNSSREIAFLINAVAKICSKFS
jgi:cysteine desulfurase family protein